MKCHSVTFRGHLFCLLCFILLPVVKCTTDRLTVFFFLYTFFPSMPYFPSKGKVKPVLLRGKKYQLWYYINMVCVQESENLT